MGLDLAGSRRDAIPSASTGVLPGVSQVCGDVVYRVGKV